MRNYITKLDIHEIAKILMTRFINRPLIINKEIIKTFTLVNYFRIMVYDSF